jgi:hypothetical protein
MTHTKVMREQFDEREHEVIHKPTGAGCSAYPGRPEITSENKGRTGNVLENGDCYSWEEVRAIAAQLLRDRKGGG